MALLTLAFGIALAWAAGTAVLRALAGPRPTAGRLPLDLGFGYFLGIAATAFLLRASDALLGAFSWWGVVAVLAGVTVVAAVLARRRRVSNHPGSAGPGAGLAQGPARWLALAFIVGIVAHVVFSAIEIVTQPVFPWDGWTVWVYRAKAWFHANALVPMVGPGRWLSATNPELYTTPALAYPLLPSLAPLWAALSLGRWHEALVNLPVLMAGGAIALGLAGCLREAGVGKLAALGTAYLLLSTPLFGAHMSLGGYGDIWLAGFAGLGMTALLCGLLVPRRDLQWLGMAFLLLGTAVKVEGLVWLTAGVVIFLLARLPLRALLITAALVAVIGTIAALTGATLVELPGLGKVGLRGDLLYVPLKGAIGLQTHDVGEAYFRNAFLLGSWHLLWTLAATVICLLAARPATPLARVAGAFFLVFVGIQVVIFVFTAEGAWARDYTAINRMPLQMLPAVLFLVVVTLAPRLAGAFQALAGARTRRAVIAGLAGGALLTVVGITTWQWSKFNDEEVPRRGVAPDALSFVLGGGQVTEDGITVSRYQDGIALLSSGQVSLQAADYPLLRLDIDFDDDIESLDQAPAFFWRRAGQAREVSRVTLQGESLVDLAKTPEWQGRIVEFGFFFVENRGEPATLANVRLEGIDFRNSLGLLPAQWTDFETWNQRSAHWLPGGSENQAVPLTGAVTVMALLAALLAWLLAGRREALLCLCIMLFTGWVVLDLRWGWDRVRQADATLTQLRTQTIEERMGDGELGVFYPYLQRIAERHLGDTPQRVLLIRDWRLHKYFGLRAKYQLLPHSVHVINQLPGPKRLENADYVLFLGPFTRLDPTRNIGERPQRRWKRLGVHGQAARQNRLELVDEDVQGTLFRVR